MAQTRGLTPALFDNVDKSVSALLRKEVREQPVIYEQYFNIDDSDRKFERKQIMVPFGDVPEKGEGANYALDVIKQGGYKDFTAVEFGLGFAVTETALEDDQHDQLSKSAQWLAYACKAVQDKYAVRVLNNGFTSETTADGVAVFSASHLLGGGGTASNVPTSMVDLSRISLEQAVIDLQTNTKQESGQLVAPQKSFVLIVHPAEEFNARRITESDKKPGSADNDDNVLKSRRWNVVVNPYISSSDDWFLFPADKKQHGVLSYKRVPITQVPVMTDPNTGNRIYKIRFRQSWGAWFWQNLYGSQGA